MCSVGGVDDSSCRGYSYYGQIYYRVTLLMYFYELIYISLDEDVLGFDMGTPVSMQIMFGPQPATYWKKCSARGGNI